MKLDIYNNIDDYMIDACSRLATKIIIGSFRGLSLILQNGMGAAEIISKLNAFKVLRPSLDQSQEFYR